MEFNERYLTKENERLRAENERSKRREKLDALHVKRAQGIMDKSEYGHIGASLLGCLCDAVEGLTARLAEAEGQRDEAMLKCNDRCDQLEKKQAEIGRVQHNSEEICKMWHLAKIDYGCHLEKKQAEIDGLHDAGNGLYESWCKAREHVAISTPVREEMAVPFNEFFKIMTKEDFSDLPADGEKNEGLATSLKDIAGELLAKIKNDGDTLVYMGTPSIVPQPHDPPALKPCPNPECLRSDVVCKPTTTDGDSWKTARCPEREYSYRVQCPCGYCGPVAPTKPLAISLHNAMPRRERVARTDRRVILCGGVRFYAEQASDSIFADALRKLMGGTNCRVMLWTGSEWKRTWVERDLIDAAKDTDD